MRGIFMRLLSLVTVGEGCRQWVDENRKEFGCFLFGLGNPFIHSTIHSAENR